MKVLKKIILIIALAMMSTNVFANKSSIISQIRKDYASTNSEKNYQIKTEEDLDFSTEGTEIKYYLKNGMLRKVVANVYFESGQQEIEYYVKNGKVYFIYEVATGFDGVYYEKYFLGKKVSKQEKVSKMRYYYDTNGKLIRYIEDDKIYEDATTLREKGNENTHKRMMEKIRLTDGEYKLF